MIDYVGSMIGILCWRNEEYCCSDECVVVYCWRYDSFVVFLLNYCWRDEIRVLMV